MAFYNNANLVSCRTIMLNHDSPLTIGFNYLKTVFKIRLVLNVYVVTVYFWLGYFL